MTAARLVVAPLVALALTLGLSGCGTDTADAPPTGDPSLISAERCAANEAAGPITFLTSFGYVASPGLLDVVVADERGLFADLCLDVSIEPGSNNAQLVSAGTAQFAGLGSPSDVLTARDNGAELVGIATYGNTVANSLLTLADSGIDSLADLEGSIAGYKVAIPPQITAMLLADGVDPEGVEWVSVGFDPSILPRGQVQALTAYKSNEPLALAAQGVEVVEWDPADYGIRSAFNTQVVNTAFAEEHPTAVEDFLRASLHAYGWINEAEGNLDDALGYAEERSDAGYDVELNRQRWATEVGLIEESQPEGLPIGGQTEEQWRPEADMLVQFGLVRGTPDLAAAIDSRFVEAIHQGTDLVWPAP